MLKRYYRTQTGLIEIFLIFSWVLFLSCSGGGGDGNSVDQNFTHSISGTIYTAHNSLIDSDVNDIFISSAPNDTIAQAQPLPNPVILGGYVNTPLSGEEGNSYNQGDLNDFYSVTLTSNQAITLYIADYSDSPPGVDLDLYLYDENEILVDSSVGNEFTESVSVPLTGKYYVNVLANIGASNYILTIGQPIISGTVLDKRMEDDFAPGHVIVAFQENSEFIYQTATSFGRTPFNLMKHTAMKHGNMHVYQFSPQNKNQVFEALRISPPESNRVLYQANNEDEQIKLDTLRIIDALNQDPSVRYAVPNYFRQSSFEPDDTQYSKQWHYPLINLPQAWDVTKGSSDVIVAVIDSGILSGHPEIQGQLTTDGYDFISLSFIANDGDGIDSDPEDEGDGMQGGSSFHGTHVSGTIAAVTNNAMGVAGVAYQSKIMPLRVLGVGGSGLSSDMMEAMLYAAGLENDSNSFPDQKADIINLSLGGSSFSQAEQDIIDLVRNENVIIIAAAGNKSSSAPFYPAGYNGVVSVSSVGPEKDLAPYSNYGTSIDVAAPGGDRLKDVNNDGIGDGVLSLSGNDNLPVDPLLYTYSYYEGTSMASPHMAGVVALMKSVDPDLSPDRLDILIKQGAITEDLAGNGPAVHDIRFGYGLIDAYKAVKAAAEPAQIESFLVVTPLTIHFGNSTQIKTLNVSKSNNDPLTILSVSDDAAWLTITPNPDVIEGFGNYTVTVSRDGLLEGPYYGYITFASNENNVNISVTMYNDVVPIAGDLGLHYVVLLDPDTYQPSYQVEVSATKGLYSYTFKSVEIGDYIVYAGTDYDNDYSIGDSGESSGAYVSLGQPVTIHVDEDLSSIDFNTHFNLNLPTNSSVGVVDHGLVVRRMKVK